MVARMDMPPHARAGQVGRGHRFAAYPRCSADAAEREALSQARSARHAAPRFGWGSEPCARVTAEGPDQPCCLLSSRDGRFPLVWNLVDGVFVFLPRAAGVDPGR